MRYIASGLFVLAVFSVVTYISLSHDTRMEPEVFEYIAAHFEDDTAARNSVAAILMNYRMYDTIFEALILLSAIIGMKAFLPSSSDTHESTKDPSGSEQHDI